MKTRLTAMAAAIYSASVLTGCGGGGPGSFNEPSGKLPTPTVTITAPATATAGFPFQISWAANNASSCTASFSTLTTATVIINKTETTPGTKQYTVTCSNADGSGSATATVDVGDAPTPEGAWNGEINESSGGNRTFGGVVLVADNLLKSNYWLAYTTGNTDITQRTPAGFITGVGTSVANSTTTGNFTSANLREFNFVTGRVASPGSLTVPYTKQTTLGTSTGAGSFTDTDSELNPIYPLHYAVTVTTTSPVYLNPSATDPSLRGPIYYTSAMSGSATYSSSVGSSTGVLTISLNGSIRMDASVLGSAPTDYNAYIDTLSMDYKLNTLTDSSGVIHPQPSSAARDQVTVRTDSYAITKACDDSDPNTTFQVCSTHNPAPSPLVPPFIANSSGNYNTIPYAVDDDTEASAGANNDPAYYTDQIFDPVGASQLKATSVLSLIPLEWHFTLTRTGVTTVTKTFNANYLSTYESIPDMTAISGSYAATTEAFTGIDQSMHSGTISSFSVTGSTISGDETQSGCSYTGTIAPHATGNVYDVTALTFSGGSCPAAYTGGTFTGVATYDSTKQELTLTATDASRNNGFMVVVTKN